MGFSFKIMPICLMFKIDIKNNRQLELNEDKKNVLLICDKFETYYLNAKNV